MRCDRFYITQLRDVSNLFRVLEYLELSCHLILIYALYDTMLFSSNLYGLSIRALFDTVTLF